MMKALKSPRLFLAVSAVVLLGAASPSWAAKSLVRGDFNQDGVFNKKDVAAARVAFLRPLEYMKKYKVSKADLVTLGDFNGDGKFNIKDTIGFNPVMNGHE